MRIPGTAPVVVGVNGTAAGLAAVRLGAREAVARGRELRVLHAFNWSGRPQDGPPKDGARPGATPDDYASARQEASRVVAEAVATARRSTPQVRVSGLLVDGLPSRVLVQQSRTAEMILLGDDDVATIPRVPIDSVLLQTVSRAWCPVVVSRGLRPPIGPVLAAVDGSPTSLLALRLAAVEARRRGVAVEVAHVVEAAGTAAEAAGHEILDAAVAAVPGLRYARKRLLIGDPAGALVRASRHVRIVIAGPRGRDGAVLLGRVAQHLLRQCACPTVFVHRATADDPWSAGTVPTAAALTT
jgi:nucleotide-binding universal stress UspA family protein